jgi:hypothetical protein
MRLRLHCKHFISSLILPNLKGNCSSIRRELLLLHLVLLLWLLLPRLLLTTPRLQLMQHFFRTFTILTLSSFWPYFSSKTSCLAVSFSWVLWDLF